MTLTALKHQLRPHQGPASDTGAGQPTKLCADEMQDNSAVGGQVSATGVNGAAPSDTSMAGSMRAGAPPQARVIPRAVRRQIARGFFYVVGFDHGGSSLADVFPGRLAAAATGSSSSSTFSTTSVLPLSTTQTPTVTSTISDPPALTTTSVAFIAF